MRHVRALLMACALATLSSCAALSAIQENARDHNAFLMKYRPADQLADPHNPLHLIRALANRFPTYYSAPICDEHGCWLP